MKNTYQKILAIILLLSVLLGAFSTASFASGKGFTEKRRQYMVLYAGRRKGQLIYGACQLL